MWGKTIEEAVMVTEMMERHCQTLVVAMMAGDALKRRWLGDEVMEELRNRVIYRKR